MAGFIEGVSRDQTTLFPERLDDWIGEDHLARVVDLFVDQLDLGTLGFQRYTAARTARTNDCRCHQGRLGARRDSA